MIPYHDSLWSQAPEGATHWAVDPEGKKTWLMMKREPCGESWWSLEPVTGDYSELRPSQYMSDKYTDLHERPSAYKSPEQLIAEYRKAHGAEIEADVQDFIVGDGENLSLDNLLDDAAFHLTLLEKHLAAERARIEGQS